MLMVVAALLPVAKAEKRNLWTEHINAPNNFIVNDSNTVFASDANCPSEMCLILRAQEGSSEDSDSGTYIDTKPDRINITGYTNITITFSYHIPSTVSGSYFRFIVYPNGTDGIPIFDEVVDNSTTTGSSVNQTQQFHLESLLDPFPGDELQLRFRTWCDEDDYDYYQIVYVDNITITGNLEIITTTPTKSPASRNLTSSPTSIPTTSESVHVANKTVLLNGTASLNTDWNEWSRSNSVSVSIVSSSYCYMASDPCARLFANNSKTEWAESLLKTPVISVENYTDILLEFNIQNHEEVTLRSVFTVDLETDEPSGHMIASYNMTELVCHPICDMLTF